MKTYQTIFNDALTKIRYSVSASVEDDSLLMRAIVKALYTMSDELVEEGIIQSREQGTVWKKKN